MDTGIRSTEKGTVPGRYKRPELAEVGSFRGYNILNSGTPRSKSTFTSYIS